MYSQATTSVLGVSQRAPGPTKTRVVLRWEGRGLTPESKSAFSATRSSNGLEKDKNLEKQFVSYMEY